MITTFKTLHTIIVFHLNRCFLVAVKFLMQPSAPSWLCPQRPVTCDWKLSVETEFSQCLSLTLQGVASSFYNYQVAKRS